VSNRPGRARRALHALIIAAAGLAPGLAGSASHAGPLPSLHFERIGTEGGPPPPVITALLQDRDGFLWIGSRNGLTLFDGYGYETFQHDPSDPGSLSDSMIRTIYEDRDGTLWIGTNTGGLNRFDSASRSFVGYRHDSSEPRSLSHDSVYTVLRDRRGTLWVGTQKGLNRFEPATRTFARIVAGGPEGLTDDYVMALYEDRAGRLWVGTLGGGLHRWDAARERFDVFRHDPSSPESLIDDRVSALREDDAGRLWIGTLRGLCVMDSERGTFRSVRAPPGAPDALQASLVTSLAAGPPGTIWVGTHGGGLAALDTASGELTYWRHDPGVRDSLSENAVIALLPDREGALWIGTWGGGLDRLSAVSQRFAGPGDAGFPPSDVPNRDVTAVLGDRRGRFWIGTRSGYLVRLDPATGRFKTVLRGGDEGVSQTLLALAEDRLGRIWLGSSSGLSRLDPDGRATGSWTHNPDDPRSLGPGFVTAILEDTRGRLWVGTGEGGVQQLDGNGAVTRRFTNAPDDPASLSDDYVTALLEDRNGRLWVGTRSAGLNELDPDTGRARRFLPVASDASSLGHHDVTSLIEDRRGRVWVGTAGGGLNRVDRGADGGIRFERVTEKHGLIDNDVTALLEDDDGSLWVTTRRGLSRYDPERRAFTGLFVSDGLPSAEFESGAAARTRERLAFGTVRGLVMLPAGAEPRISSPSPVVVRSVRTASGEARGRDALRVPGRMELPYGTWLSVELAVLDYSPELEHRYAYRLDDDWIDIGSRREITFTSLHPGTHALRIRGRNSQGVWGEASAPLEIEVVPPFWMTVRFRILVIALVIAAAFGAHRRRTSVLEKRNRELVELQRQRERASQDLDDAYQRLRRLTNRLEAAKEDERKRIARELHDDLGPSLTAVIINLQLLTAQRKPEQLGRRIEETVELVDRMIQRIRDISLDLRPPLIDELGLVPALGGYLESVSARTGLTISLGGDEDLGALPAHVPITVFRVVQEAVTNVIRHAGSCRVEVAVRRDGSGIDVSVEDDGAGFDVGETMEHAATGKAIGLLGMQERVDMVGGTIDIESVPGAGTRIRVRLPLVEAA
jgi:signal transduction histidine kinase/ligand-binding sensor domain-containing protein